MTRAAWAERKVRALQQRHKSLCLIEIAEVGILAEHRRAVRVVRCELEKYQRQREGETNASRRDMLGGAMLACSNILAALQKGRT